MPTNSYVHGISSDSRLPVRGQTPLGSNAIPALPYYRFLGLHGLCLVYDLDAAIDLQGFSCWSTVVGSFDGASRLGGCEA
jgi:hypothetical protein